ncbi:MAG TPA: hypothetical protein PLI12_11270, partial [Acetobacteraceae bacterium]|nr:hypothetical protein [Acetobacteraceae bacterium]
MINGPDGSYFAVSVTKEMPAAVRPFAQVSAQVGKAWIAEQTERTQEAAAAGLLLQGRPLHLEATPVPDE